METGVLWWITRESRGGRIVEKGFNGFLPPSLNGAHACSSQHRIGNNTHTEITDLSLRVGCFRQIKNIKKKEGSYTRKWMCNSVRTLSSRMIHSIVIESTALSPPRRHRRRASHDSPWSLSCASFHFFPPTAFISESPSLTDLYKVIFLYMWLSPRLPPQMASAALFYIANFHHNFLLLQKFWRFKREPEQEVPDGLFLFMFHPRCVILTGD